METVCRPVKKKERIVALDVLRGLALLGILMVNLPLMYEPISKMLLGSPENASTSHLIGEGIIKFFFEGKFYVIFSMLFGYGFWMFLNKEQTAGKSIVGLYRKRIFFLLLFGLFHIVFLWAGDILFFYALFGFVLIWFRKASDKKIKRWIVALLSFPIVFSALVLLMIQGFSGIPEAQSAMDASFQETSRQYGELASRAAEIYANGSFSDIINIRVEEYFTLFFGALFYFCPVILAMFLVGFLAAKRGYIANYQDHIGMFRSVFKGGLILGLITNGLYVLAYRNANMIIPDAWSLLSTSMHIIGGVSLGMFYVSAVILLFQRNKASCLQEYIAPTGRMALTNYFTHSVVAVILFHPWGLGLFGKIDVWAGIAIALVVFVLQIFISKWWLRDHRFGPMEWLWRRLTYGRLSQ